VVVVNSMTKAIVFVQSVTLEAVDMILSDTRQIVNGLPVDMLCVCCCRKDH